MKTFLWLMAVLASGVIGFYFGVDQGAKTSAALVAQNEVADGLARIRVSLDALEKNDPAHANDLQKRNLGSALFQIGSYSEGLAYWACTDKDRETIRAAHDYAQANPDVLDGPTKAFQTRALEFCSAKPGKEKSGA